MNVELLRKIAASVQAEPENFDMANWHCGTSHCVAGWAEFLERGTTVHSKGCANRACSLLDISDKEGSRLFYVSNWPKEFNPEHGWPSAQQVVARIEHFIETGGTE